MKFTRHIISAVFLTCAAANAFAAEMNAGKIHFTGQIIEPSCIIKGDNGTDSTVPLGTYPTSLFDSVGKESTLKSFSIKLAECPVASDGLPAVQLTFNGPTTLTSSASLLDVSKITTSGEEAATGVGIAISPEGSDTTYLKFDGSENQIKVDLPTVKDDTVTAYFNARYKSFAQTVTAGAADADLTINILYR